MATLIACAPWEPPKIRTLARLPAALRGVRAFRRCSAAKNSGRTGLPATNPLLPKKDTVESNVTAAALTTRDKMRLVRPGTAFCSASSVGMPRSAASITTGPEL